VGIVGQYSYPEKNYKKKTIVAGSQNVALNERSREKAEASFSGFILELIGQH
jgi:hypothetical protein